MFWEVMAPKAGGSPRGDLAKAIDAALGSFDNFKAEFEKAADGPLWIRLGMARQEGEWPGGGLDCESGQSGLRGHDARDGH